MAAHRRQRQTRIKRGLKRAVSEAAQIAQERERVRALDVLNMMRTKRYSLTKAAKESRITKMKVLRYVSSAVQRAANGRYWAQPSDRLLRKVRVLTADGPILVDVRGSRKASLLARHLSAVGRYLNGDADALAGFDGKSVKVGKVLYPFLTDRQTLERLAHAGEISVEGFYALTA